MDNKKQDPIEALKKTVESVKIQSKGIENGYRWIIIKTPFGREVKLQEGYGEDIYKQDENTNLVYEAARLVRYIKETEKVVESKDVGVDGMYEIIRRFPSWELQGFVNAYFWFTKESSAPELYPFRLDEYKQTGAK
jgi:hypothetical protein